MTDQSPTSSGTPLWQPQPPAPYSSPWPPVPTQDPRVQTQPYAPAPQPYPPQPYHQAQAPYAPQPYPQAQPPYAPQPYPQAQAPYAPAQPLPNQAFPGASWPSNPGVVAPPTGAKRWQSPLPVEPMRHHQFLHTPRRRWWKLPIALLVAGLAWLIGIVIATLPAIAYDLLDQKISLTDPVALENFLSAIPNNVTPAFFLANNVGIALMIPAAWLGLIIYGQRPRWLSSVTGRLRWGWMLRLMALMAIPYLAMQAFEFAVGGSTGLSWRPYSLFMIFVVLLTTPLQCAGEEYGIRGLINRLLGSYGSARISFWIGAIGSSVVFMFLHAAQDPYLNAFYFTFGMVACWMAWRTGGLEASIAMHVVNNVLAMSGLPFSDFSGMFDRGVGSANALDLAPLALVMLACVGIVEWQARRNKPIAMAAPGATDAPPTAFRFTALESVH